MSSYITKLEVSIKVETDTGYRSTETWVLDPNSGSANEIIVSVKEEVERLFLANGGFFG